MNPLMVGVGLSLPQLLPSHTTVAGLPATSPAPYRVCNIGNQQLTRLMDYIKCIENAIGREAKKDLLPMQQGDVYQTYADTSALGKATGFRPDTNLQDGINRTVVWFKQYYNL